MIAYGINTFLWASPFKTQHLPLLDKAKGLGFDLVEIPIEDEQDIDYAMAAEAFKRTGLQCSLCSVMGPGRDPTHEDEAIQNGGVAYLKHLVDAAVTVKAIAVVGPHYAAVGRTWQATPDQRKRDLERCAKNLKRVARYAEDKGVTLAMEPLNRFETSFINLTEQALELVRMIDSPRVKLMMDTFHANIEEKSLGKAIEAAGPLLVHVHANENDRGTPGHGARGLDRDRRGAEEGEVQRGACHRVLLDRSQGDCPRRGRLAAPRAHRGRPRKKRPGVPEKSDGLRAREESDHVSTRDAFRRPGAGRPTFPDRLVHSQG